MRWLLLVLLVSSLMVDVAEARHHHRRHHYYYSRGADQAEFLLSARRHEELNLKVPRPASVAALVPPDWREQPANADWDGKRYLSPDGTSWIAVYRTEVGSEAINDHLKSVIFAPNETITYLRGDGARVAVSGHKDDRVVYRKAVLACEGKEWHHVAFEYPIQLKERIEPLVIAVARTLDTTLTDCRQPVAQR